MTEWKGKTTYNPVTGSYYALSEDGKIIGTVKAELEQAKKEAYREVIEFVEQENVSMAWSQETDYVIEDLKQKFLADDLTPTK